MLYINRRNSHTLYKGRLKTETRNPFQSVHVKYLFDGKHATGIEACMVVANLGLAFEHGYWL